MKKRRFPRISTTAARRVVLVLIALAAVLCSGCQSSERIEVVTCNMCSGQYNEHNDKEVSNHAPLRCVLHSKCSIGEEGIDIHFKLCEFCEGPLCTGDHGDGICDKKKEEPPQEQQTQQVITCQVCRGTLAEGESHHAPCGNAAHCTKDGKTHDAASCGTSGHYACDGKSHDKLPCWHYACDGKKHDMATCGHFACDDGLHKKAACGVEGHYTCDSGNHGACGDCGAVLCDGHIHKIEVTVAPVDPVAPDGGPVSVPATVACPNCGTQVGDTADHLAPCRSDGHFTCAAGYVAEPHVNYADCNVHRQCAAGDHSYCCGIPKCSNRYVASEHGLLACGRHCKYSNKGLEHLHTENCPYA